jgi:hypothetical protein
MTDKELEKWCHICPVRTFFLNHGRAFAKYVPRPDWVEPGTPKECYRNSFLAAITKPNLLVYCEGLAWPDDGDSPCEHAWVITHDQEVIDPTWHDLTLIRKVEYWGIPFKWEFVADTVKRTGTYGVVGNWEEDYPLLNGRIPAEEYLWTPTAAGVEA